MSENDKITQLDNIRAALEKDDFLLATSFFNTSVSFKELFKKGENIKNTVKTNLKDEAEAEEICKIFGLSGDGIFKDLVEAERLKHINTNEYNLVEKNGVGVQDLQLTQIYQAINPRRKLMTYTELTNTEAYDIVFKQIFDKAKEKINGNSDITVAEALKSSMEELIMEKQVEKSLEQLELEIIRECNGLSNNEKERKIKEIKEKYIENIKNDIGEDNFNKYKTKFDGIENKDIKVLSEEKQNKLRNRIKFFKDKAEEIVKNNSKNKYIAFSDRHKMAIIINQYNLKKLKREQNWGKEQEGVLKNKIDELKKRVNDEEKLFESDYDKLDSLEKKLKYKLLKLSEAYEKYDTRQIKKLTQEIEGNKDLQKEYFRLKLRDAVEMDDIEEFKKIEKEIEDFNKGKKEREKINIDIANEVYDSYKSKDNNDALRAGRNLLHIAAANESQEIFKYLIEEKGMDINRTSTYLDENGIERMENIANIAVRYGNLDLIKYLKEEYLDKEKELKTFNISSSSYYKSINNINDMMTTGGRNIIQIAVELGAGYDRLSKLNNELGIELNNDILLNSNEVQIIVNKDKDIGIKKLLSDNGIENNYYEYNDREDNKTIIYYDGKDIEKIRQQFDNIREIDNDVRVSPNNLITIAANNKNIVFIKDLINKNLLPEMDKIDFDNLVRIAIKNRDISLVEILCSQPIAKDEAKGVDLNKYLEYLKSERSSHPRESEQLEKIMIPVANNVVDSLVKKENLEDIKDLLYSLPKDVVKNLNLKDIKFENGKNIFEFAKEKKDYALMQILKLIEPDILKDFIPGGVDENGNPKDKDKALVFDLITDKALFTKTKKIFFGNELKSEKIDEIVDHTVNELNDFLDEKGKKKINELKLKRGEISEKKLDENDRKRFLKELNLEPNYEIEDSYLYILHEARKQIFSEIEDNSKIKDLENKKNEYESLIHNEGKKIIEGKTKYKKYSLDDNKKNELESRIENVKDIYDIEKKIILLYDCLETFNKINNKMPNDDKNRKWLNEQEKKLNEIIKNDKNVKNYIDGTINDYQNLIKELEEKKEKLNKITEEYEKLNKQKSKNNEDLERLKKEKEYMVEKDINWRENTKKNLQKVMNRCFSIKRIMIDNEIEEEQNKVKEEKAKATGNLKETIDMELNKSLKNETIQEEITKYINEPLSDELGTPLKLAIESGREDIIEVLLQQKNLIITREEKKKLNNFATKNSKIFELLGKKGIFNKKNYTKLFNNAVKGRNTELIRQLFLKSKKDNDIKIDINAEIDGKTPLQIAIENNDERMANLLVQLEGIEIENAPIYNAENIEIIKLLARDVKIKNMDQLLTNAVEKGRKDIIEFIFNFDRIEELDKDNITNCIKSLKGDEPNSIKNKDMIDLLNELLKKSKSVEKYNKGLEEKERKKEEKRKKEEEAKNYIDDLDKGLIENRVNLSNTINFINKIVKPLNPHLSLANLTKGAKDNLLLLIAREGKKDDLKFFEENLNFDVKNIKNSAELNLFFLAIREGNIELVKSLVEENKNIINEPLSTDQTPLMLATEWKRESIINYLIENSADITAESIGGKTTLYYAVENNNIELVKTLIEKDSESINQTIEFPDKRKQSLFFMAVEKGNKEIINLFLKQKDNLKINFTETNKYGETLLHYLFNEKNMDLINKLSGFEGFNINVQDDNGKTLLHYAVDTGLPVLINGLTEIKDININVRDKDGKAPLHYAIKNNDAIITQSLFIKPGIDVNVEDNEGQSPLFTAVKNNNIELIKILTAREGIDPNIVDNYENSPLHYAVRKGNKEIVECLLNIKGVKIEKPSEDRPSPFLVAVKNDNKEIMDLFLERADELKIDFNEKDENNISLLYYAVKNNNKELINLLIEKGAEIKLDEKDENKMSLLHYAAENNNMELVKKLINEKNFNPNITDGRNMTPLYYAVANSNKETVEYLLSIEGIEIIEPIFASNPFFKAMKVNNKDIIKLFLKQADKLKIDFNKKNWRNGNSLLHYAIINKDKEIFDDLINRGGININIKNAFGCSPLMYAIKNKNQYAINTLIKRGAKIDFNEVDNDSRNILHYAAENNNVELIKQLLDIDGIDLTIKDKSGRTAIDYMDRNIGSDMFIEEYQEIVEDLRERTEQQLKEKENKEKVENEDNKETNSKNSSSKDISSADDPKQKKNKDKIFEAIENEVSYDDIISKLKENNFELEDLKTLRNSDGKTLLHIAAENRNQDLVKDLIEKGGLDPNLKDNYNYTPLYYAIENNKNDTKDLEANKEDIVGFLLGQHDVQNKINEKLGSGSYKSLLSAAVLSGNVKIVEMLISRGADVNITNSLGQTPIFDAIAIGNEEMIDLLTEKGADFNIKSNSGKTAIDYAKYYVKNGYINNEIATVVQNAVEKSISKTLNPKAMVKNKLSEPENTKKYTKDLEDVKLEQHKLENKLFNPLAIEGSDAELIKEKSSICNILMMRIRTAEKKLEKRKEELNELKEKIKKESEIKEKQKLEEELKKRVEDFENRVELIKTREEILKTQKEELNLLIESKIYNKEESNNKYLEQQKKLKEVLSRVYAANRELGGQERSIS